MWLWENTSYLIQKGGVEEENRETMVNGIGMAVVVCWRAECIPGSDFLSLLLFKQP